ncbi:MAG: HAMP domain-containing histidine kinase [Firmicutes bacterium]|nr:HAMP domain-containing histidine kinase [Bacillota bacterium]
MSTKVSFDSKSIRLRLWFYLVGIGIGVVALIWFLHIFFLNNYYEEMKISEVDRVATSISAAYLRGDDHLESTMQELSISNDFYVIMESGEGLLLFTPESDNRLPVYRYLDQTPRLKQLLKKSHSSPVYFEMGSGIENYDTLAYGCKISGKNVDTVYLYIFSPLYPVSSTVNILRSQLMYVTVVTLVIAFILAFYFAEHVSRPIKKITVTAEEMGKGNYDVKFDIDSYSEINNLADTLNTAAYELGQADNRMKDLIANVSHDLKTPLTMIRSYAEMIKDLSGDIPEKRNAHLQVIMDESDRLSQLVGDMATISKMQTHKTVLERSTFELVSATKSILSSYDILSEQEGYKFNLHAPKTAYVFGDENKLKQVISNLVNNAVKYCGEDKVVNVNIRKVAKKYRVEVIDHGPGISQEELPHVWDRYYKASSNYIRSAEGTGLGLSIVKGILTLHHANFGVTSKLGKGTNFWFELPLMKKPEDKNTDKEMTTNTNKSIPQDPESIEQLDK